MPQREYVRQQELADLKLTSASALDAARTADRGPARAGIEPEERRAGRRANP